MKILIFTEGTILMHKNALGHSREEIVKQVEDNEESVRDFSSYIPIGNSAKKISKWKEQGVKIFYLTSRRKLEEVDQISQVLKNNDFPEGELLFRKENEEYKDVTEKVFPDVLIEDDCESIGGTDEMTITHVKPKIREKIKSMPVKEFGGIDYLPDDINKIKYQTVLTEDVDYSKTGTKSIWGRGEEETLKIIRNELIKGRWLNLAAGDGRYNNNLLEKADFVIASDIDSGALEKLKNLTKEHILHKLEVVSFDMNKSFPFADSEFEGLFCIGTLHLFCEEKLNFIIGEINRVLKNNGKLIIDFATDIKRILPNNKLYLKKGEHSYSMANAKKILEKLLKNYRLNIIESTVPKEKVAIGDLEYIFSCNFLICVGVKQ